MFGNDRAIYRQLTKEDKQILLVAYNIKREGFEVSTGLLSKRTKISRKEVEIRKKKLHEFGLL